MNSIQFKNDISLEQYNMIVRVLEALNIEVKKNNISSESCHGLTKEDLKRIEISHQQAEQGKMVTSEEVHKKMWAKYGD